MVLDCSPSLSLASSLPKAVRMVGEALSLPAPTLEALLSHVEDEGDEGEEERWSTESSEGSEDDEAFGMDLDEGSETELRLLQCRSRWEKICTEWDELSR